MQITIDDDPLGNDFSGSVTLGNGTTTLDNGLLTLTQTLVPEGPNAEWLILNYQATGGGLIGGDSGGYWDYDATAQTDGPTFLTSYFLNWTLNGSFFDSITPFGGLGNIATDPLNPSLGNVFTGGPFGPGTSWDLLAEVSPYSYALDGGIDVSTANGFVVAGLVTSAAVPEPSSLALMGIATAGGLIAMKCRRRGR